MTNKDTDETTSDISVGFSVIKRNFREPIPIGYTGIVEYTDGYTEYFENGLWHRIGGPAIESKAGHRVWLEHGLKHREDGPARIEPNEDGEFWYKHGELHRIGGPAVILLKEKKQEWWENGKRHNLSGAAITQLNEKDELILRRWFINGIEYDESGLKILLD